MADNVGITPGSGKTIATDEVTDGTLGTVQVQFVKLMDGTLDGNQKAKVVAASTAAAATDPALVVALSPNGRLTGGAVAASSEPVVIATNQPTLSFAMDTTQLANGVTGTNLAPTKVKIAVTTATTTTLVAAQTGPNRKVRIISMYVVSSAACTITLQSATTTSTSDGGLAYAANSGMSLAFNPIGWFDTVAGEALAMVTSATSNVSGVLSYIAV